MTVCIITTWEIKNGCLCLKILLYFQAHLLSPSVYCLFYLTTSFFWSSQKNFPPDICMRFSSPYFFNWMLWAFYHQQPHCCSLDQSSVMIKFPTALLQEKKGFSKNLSRVCYFLLLPYGDFSLPVDMYAGHKIFLTEATRGQCLILKTAASGLVHKHI